MPASKRSKVVALTKTSKKTNDHKSSIVQDIRTTIDSHTSLYLFSFENMRSHKFKSIRIHFHPESRLFLGKNKLMQIAMGRCPEEEHADNLRRVSELCTGSVGLLMTSRPRDEVMAYFADLREDDFAKAGATAGRSVVVTNEMVATHPVSMVEHFKTLGVPVEVQNGRVGLVGGKREFQLCKEGQALTAEMCKVLVHFGIKLAEFRVNLVCRWENGDFESFV